MLTYAKYKPALRPAIAPYERLVNAHQRALLRQYARWSVQVRRRLLQAEQRGAQAYEKGMILNTSLAYLQNALIDEGRRGIIGASRIAVPKAAQAMPSVRGITRQLIGANNQMVRDAIPEIGINLITQIESIPLEPKPLYEVFNGRLGRIGGLAGMAWQAIFQVQQTYGIQREQEFKAAGEPIEPIRWGLDPSAIHCRESPGHYGCPEMEGKYDSWRELLTVPAGQVTCRGNCRCHLEVYHDGGWHRGFE